MLAGHRWKPDYDFRGYRCVPLPFGGVESYQWCIGCNAFIGKIEVYNLYGGRQLTDKLELHLILDMIAAGMGFEPVEDRTFKAYEIKKTQEYKENKRTFNNVDYI